MPQNELRTCPSFISTGKDDVREFFTNAAGCVKEFSNTRATEEAYKLVRSITESYPNLRERIWDVQRIVTDYFDCRLEKYEGKIDRTELFTHVANLSSSFCPDDDIIENGEIIKISKNTFLDKMLTIANSEECNIPLIFNAVQGIVDKKKQYTKKYKESYIRISLEDIGSSAEDLLYFDEDTGLLYVNDPELVEKIRQKKDNEDS